MQIVVFHRFAYTCCTASFQPFCGMPAIRYNVLSNRTFLQVCYRTLDKCKGSGFLGIYVIYGMVFLSKKVLNNRKSVIEENFCRTHHDSFEKSVTNPIYSLEKV